MFRFLFKTKLSKCTTALICFSVVVYILVWQLGALERPDPAPDNYRTYWQKPNWYLFPAFFLLVSLAISKTWEPFRLAWSEDYGKSKLLQDKDGKYLKAKDREKLVVEIVKYRKYIVILSFIASFIFNYIDLQPLVGAYIPDNENSQLQYANNNPDFFVGFVFQQIGPGIVQPSAGDWIVFVVCSLQQYFVLVMAFVVLFQVTYHVLLFGLVADLTKTGKALGVQIVLDWRSANKDFGLTYWNRAFDGFYFIVSLAIFAPIISRLSHGSDPAPGHILGNYLIPILLFVPFFFSIATRQTYANKAQDQAARVSNEDLELCNENKVWPLDKNRLAKIWMLVSISLYLVYVTGEWTGLLDIILKQF